MVAARREHGWRQFVAFLPVDRHGARMGRPGSTYEDFQGRGKHSWRSMEKRETIQAKYAGICNFETYFFYIVEIIKKYSKYSTHSFPKNTLPKEKPVYSIFLGSSSIKNFNDVCCLRSLA